MPSDAYREARAAAKQARAEAKRARRRWLDLRPWYFKKRFVLGIPILLAMAAAVAFLAISLERGDSDTASATDGQPFEADAAADVARIGALVRVGSLDLTVLSFEPFDGRSFGSSNDVNYRLRFQATNTRGPGGDDYRLVDTAFRIVDATGATHEDWHATCQGCPDVLGTGKSIALGSTIEGAVYFRIPQGQTPAELHYRAPGSTNTARIALR